MKMSAQVSICALLWGVVGMASGQAGLDTQGAPGGKGVGDSSALASPVTALPRAPSISVGTEVKVTLTGAVDSGVASNGDKVFGTLAMPLRTSTGTTLPVGTAVKGTVVSSARAGTVNSGGILSLQLTGVGGIALISDVIDFNGAEGHKDVADSAPAKGSEAVVAAGAMLAFHVLQPGKETGLIPGVKPAAVPATGGQGSTGQGSTGQGSTGAAPAQGVPGTPVHGATQGVTPH